MNTQAELNKNQKMRTDNKISDSMKNSETFFGSAALSLPIEKGAPLAGYGIPRFASQSSDDLRVQAAVLNREGKMIIFCGLDILAADENFKLKVEEKLHRRKIQYDGIIIHAIHTHSSYGGLLQTKDGLLKGTAYFAGEQNDALIDQTAELTCDCIEKAVVDLHQTRFWKGRSILENVVSDRVRGTIISQPVFVIEAEAESKPWMDEESAKKKSDRTLEKDVFVFFACHPTVLYADNLVPSADFAGFMRSELQNKGWRNVFFINGACGDLSCRYTRKESSLKEAKRIGEAAAKSAADALAEKEPFKLDDLPGLTYQAELKSAPVLSKSEADSLLKQALADLGSWDGKDSLMLRRLQIRRDAAKAACIKAGNDDGNSKRMVDGICWRAGDEYFVTVPGEFFSVLTARLPENVHILGYTNGYMLYLPDEQSYENQIYEAMSSPFACGEPEKLMNIIEKTLQQLKNPLAAEI